MPFSENISNWRDHVGPIGVEPLTPEQLRKKVEAAAKNKNKKPTGDQFDEEDLRVIGAVND